MQVQPPSGPVISGLFGLTRSNSTRDFSLDENWGKNQFNSSFPAALALYLEAKGFENVYLKLNENLQVYHSTISTTALYGGNPAANELHYAFESIYAPFELIVQGKLPRTDLVVKRADNATCLRGLEIKLTALPDNSTCHLSEDRYGCELVVRPNTIVYLACSLAMPYRNDRARLRDLLGDGFEAIANWNKGVQIPAAVINMVAAIDRVARTSLAQQEPLLMQPVWKTQGKSLHLAENCLDVFVWSNLAFTQLFLDVARNELSQTHRITRRVRTLGWLFKMLCDFSLNGQIDHRGVVGGLAYDTKNDKAFAVSGRVTNYYMKCDELKRPRITKSQIQEIILGGGQNKLSPERRFDAVIFNTSSLFNQV